MIRKSIPSKAAGDIIIVCALVLTGILFFPLNGVAPSPDSSWYLNNASNLFNDFSHANLMVRRPLFPFLISLSFHLFGKSIESALFVVRLFFVFNLVLAYIIGLKFYNRQTGIAFSLLLLSSFVINRWSSYLLLDAIIPFFIFSYLLALFQAHEKKSRFLFGVSGLILGMAFLIKGVFAFFFMFLPVLLLVLKKHRTRGQIPNILFAYGVALVVLSPWLGYCIQQNDFSILVGRMFDSKEIKASGVVPAIMGQGVSPILFFLKQMEELVGFFNIYIHKIFVLSYLFIISAVYTMGRLLSKKKQAAHFYLFFSVLLFSPVIYIGMKSRGVNFRDGQFLVLYFLLYLMMAYTMADLSSRIAGLFSKGAKKKYINAVIFSCFLLVCLFFQIFIGATDNRTFYALTQENKIRNVYGFSFWQNEFNACDGWANALSREAAEWITTHIPKQETILCQWSYLRMLDYLTNNQYTFQLIEYRFSHDVPGKNPLFIWPRYNFKILEGNSLVALYEDVFLSQVNQDRVTYIVVTDRRNFLSLYLKNHPDFEQIHSITHGKGNVKLFKTKGFPVRSNPEFNVKFTENIYTVFQLAAGENKAVFESLKHELGQILSWNNAQLESFSLFVNESDQEGFWKAYEQVRPKTIY